MLLLRRAGGASRRAGGSALARRSCGAVNGVLARTQSVLVEHDGSTTWLRLNAPASRNALSADMVEGLVGGVQAATTRGSSLLVLAGEGVAFSGGFDLSGLGAQSDANLLHRFVRVEQFLQQLHNVPMATAALVQGRCVGAAADAVACCRHRIATPEATFRFPGLRFGLVLGTRRLTHLVGADNALDFLETSREISAQDAADAGLVTAIVDQVEWPEFVAELAEASRALPAATKAALLHATRPRRQEACDDQDLAALVRSAATPGLKDRVQAFVDAQKQLAARRRS